MPRHRNLPREQARSLRRDLKTAVTGFASGTGDLAGLFNQIERIAQYVKGSPHVDLAKAKGALKSFVAQSTSARPCETGLPGVSFDLLYEEVRKARNDLAHTGTEAALASRNVGALAVVLMGALAMAAQGKNGLTVEDAMVSNPTCAQAWQTLADVRRTMLVNDYSALPISDGSCASHWRCVDAKRLAAYLLDPKDRKEREKMELSAALTCDTPLLTLDAPAVPPCTLVKCAMEELPAIVVRQVSDKPEIVGIVTAFDLL